MGIWQIETIDAISNNAVCYPLGRNALGRPDGMDAKGCIVASGVGCATRQASLGQDAPHQAPALILALISP